LALDPGEAPQVGAVLGPAPLAATPALTHTVRQLKKYEFTINGVVQDSLTGTMF
jgi:hypothetical protein